MCGVVLPTNVNIAISLHAETMSSYLASAPPARPQITCFRCGEQGHYKSECFHWKTRLCWHDQHGAQCSDSNCAFAHGISELREPWLPRCIRVIKKEGQLVSLGCRAYGHTFKQCPEHRIR